MAFVKYQGNEIMFATKFGRQIKIFVAALATLALTAGSAPARVINFIELGNDLGIQMTADDGTDVTVAAETFYLSSAIVPLGYPANAKVTEIGNSRSGFEALISILESVGGPLSDQVWLHHIYDSNSDKLFTVIDFISDPNQFIVGIEPYDTVVETGALQTVLEYTNDKGGLVQINVLSDVDVTIPEPATLALLGLGLAGIGFSRRKQ